MRPRRAAAALAAAMVWGLAAAPGAVADPAGSVTATGGAVQATLSWSKGQGLGGLRPRVTIARAGTTIIDAAPAFADDCWRFDCRFLPSGDRPSAVQVADLNGDGEPEVLLDAFTLGAHCCALSEIHGYSGSPDGGYLVRTVAWGNGGYDLEDLDGDGTLEFVSSDDRFSARYTAYALSARPLRILRYVQPGVALSHVTKRFPAAIEADLGEQRRLLADARRQRLDRRGVVAAIVADLYSIRRAKDAQRELRVRRQSGDLGPPARARSFEAALLRDLRRWGYR